MVIRKTVCIKWPGLNLLEPGGEDQGLMVIFYWQNVIGFVEMLRTKSGPGIKHTDQ